MNSVWRSAQYGVNTKLKLCQSCVVSTILYGSECWRMNRSDLIVIPSTALSTPFVFTKFLGYSRQRRYPMKACIGDASKKTWVLSSQDDDGDGYLFCGDNQRYSPERDFAGRLMEREREENRQHGEQLRAR